MDILFIDDDLEELCSTERLQKRHLGKAGTRKLRARLAELMAASTVADLIAGHPHPLRGVRVGQFALSLDGGRRLVFEPAHNPPLLRDDGSVAWNRVTRVRIVFIGDYHD